jgi:hypothetical protein
MAIITPQMQSGRVFSEAMPVEIQIIPFCAPQRMDTEIPAAVHIGGSARGYQALFASLAIAVPHMTPGATLHPPNDRCY